MGIWSVTASGAIRNPLDPFTVWAHLRVVSVQLHPHYYPSVVYKLECMYLLSCHQTHPQCISIRHELCLSGYYYRYNIRAHWVESSRKFAEYVPMLNLLSQSLLSFKLISLIYSLHKVNTVYSNHNQTTFISFNL